MGEDGKSEVIDSKKLEKCGGESVCPMGAIERIGEEGKGKEGEKAEGGAKLEFTPGQGRGLEMGRGRGMGAGRGKRFGRGPQDGRGRGGRGR